MQDYIALVKAFSLVPIRNAEHHQRAVSIIQQLMSTPDLTDGADAYLNTLVLLVQEYEARVKPAVTERKTGNAICQRIGHQSIGDIEPGCPPVFTCSTCGENYTEDDDGLGAILLGPICPDNPDDDRAKEIRHHGAKLCNLLGPGQLFFESARRNSDLN